VHCEDSTLTVVCNLYVDEQEVDEDDEQSHESVQDEEHVSDEDDSAPSQGYGRMVFSVHVNGESQQISPGTDQY
jgi:hypothetical protein